MTESRDVAIGQRILAARERLGLTQDALGEAIGAGKTVVSKIEHGKRRVDGFELGLLAQRLGTSPRELLGMPGKRSLLAVAARLDPAGGSASSAVRRARQLLELDALADELDLPHHSGLSTFKTPTGPNRPQRAAADLRAELGLGDGGVADLPGLCERELGIDVAVEVLPDGPDGLLVHDGAEVGLTMIRADQPAGRQRFTLAHEVGHLVLGDGKVVIVEADVVGSDDTAERNANDFASAFLMPKSGILRIAGDDRVDIPTFVDLCVSFGVSREAMAYRLLRLRLIDERERQQFLGSTVRSLFAAAGRSADFDAWAAPAGQRPPTRIQRRLQEAYVAGRIGISPLAELHARDPEELRQELAEAGIVPTYAENDFALDVI